MAWLSGWAAEQRIELVIDNTKIDGALTNFPVMVKLSSSSGIDSSDISQVFDELASDANRLKIAVTEDDEVTECKVEIEHWDDASELAILHVKVPAVASGADTTLYLYYDSAHADNTTNVGDIGDAPAQAVWDSDFKLVYHMAQDPSGGADCIKDSTSNGNDGTPAGSMTAGDLVDGLSGAKAIDFDGSNDLINAGSDSTIDDLAPLLIEAVFNAGTYGESSWGRICEKSNVSSNGFGLFLEGSNDRIAITMRASTDGKWITPDNSIEVETDYHVGMYVDRTDAPASVTDPVFHINGTKPAVTELTTPAGSWEADAAYDLLVANRGGADRSYDGEISEFRISNIERSDAWVKATYHSLFDSLITLTDEYPPEGSGTIPIVMHHYTKNIGA